MFVFSALLSRSSLVVTLAGRVYLDLTIEDSGIFMVVEFCFQRIKIADLLTHLWERPNEKTRSYYGPT